MTKKIFMTGLTGLIGRWTAARMTAEGHHVIALMRGAAARGDTIRHWIAAHEGDTSGLTLVEGDLERVGLGLSAEDRTRLSDITHVCHFGALMDWSRDRKRMHQVNVAATLDLLGIAAQAPRLESFVHISGYLITADAFWRAQGFSRDEIVANPRKGKKFFRHLAEHASPYEASKIEADIHVRRARAAGLPVTIINPATVLGHSQTGEAHQLFGIEGLIKGLGNGSLAAVPGKPDDWLPFVSIDYLAEFLTRAALKKEAAGMDYTLLHQGTPRLIQTLAIIADELGKKPPRRYIPLWVLRPLLKAGLDRRTGTPVDALAFINAFRFDTSSAERATVEAGLVPTDIEQALRLSVRHYMATQESLAA
tara:strand:+ start:211123 stop:212217 length:1095 start_codon:yes stop_codon:yes gene_type:complete